MEPKHDKNFVIRTPDTQAHIHKRKTRKLVSYVSNNSLLQDYTKKRRQKNTKLEMGEGHVARRSQIRLQFEHEINPKKLKKENT